jgi:hypothetical protein
MNTATQHDIEALADSLSSYANTLHARLMRALRRAPDGGETAISQSAAQTLFDHEVALRQRANSLYLQAGTLAAAGLGVAQQQLLEVTAQAHQSIDKIERIKDLIDLTAEILSFGAALASGKPEKLVTPFENLKHHLQALRAPG